MVNTLVLSLIFTIHLIFLSFKEESVTAFFLFNIITGMVTILTSAIEFIKGLFRDRHLAIAEENRRSLLVISKEIQMNQRSLVYIIEEIQRIRRTNERRLVIEDKRRTQSSYY